MKQTKMIVLTVIGTRPEAIFYAILIFNALTPILDRFRPKPFGLRT